MTSHIADGTRISRMDADFIAATHHRTEKPQIAQIGADFIAGIAIKQPWQSQSQSQLEIGET